MEKVKLRTGVHVGESGWPWMGRANEIVGVGAIPASRDSPAPSGARDARGERGKRSGAAQ
jgi:hypothetical protein